MHVRCVSHAVGRSTIIDHAAPAAPTYTPTYMLQPSCDSVSDLKAGAPSDRRYVRFKLRFTTRFLYSCMNARGTANALGTKEPVAVQLYL